MNKPDELKDGQIYRWRWADDKRDADCGQYGSYHCRSRIAIVHGGKLIDTYWSGMISDGRLNKDDVLVELIADKSWQKIKKWDLPYYDSSDVIDTRHANDGNAPIYLKPGATRSKQAIIESIDYRVQQAEQNIRSAQFELERLAQKRVLAEEGRLDEIAL